MCFNKTEESKLLIAKRDITVYKVGYFADQVNLNTLIKMKIKRLWMCRM